MGGTRESTKACKPELIQNHLVRPVSHWNPAIAQAREASLLSVGEELESRMETRISRFFEEKKQEKNIYKSEVFLTEMRNKLKGSKLGYFKSTRENDSATNLSRW